MVSIDSLAHGQYDFTFETSIGSTIEYKFTQGSWATEALDSNGFIPQNPYHSVKKMTLLK